MPELPEVETVRKTLEQLIIGETIERITVYWPKIIKSPDDYRLFSELVIGEVFHNIQRKGKFLMFELTNYTLVSHLRMEGKYGVYSDDDPLDKHVHVVFHLESGKQLRYHDVRKFGTMHLFEKGQALEQKPLNQLGPDPFEGAYTLEYVLPKITKSERAIKNILLDQQIIAGLGNIYVDETLFRAKVHPLRKGTTLTEPEVMAILDEAKQTLLEAVEQGGTTIRSYVNSQGKIGMFQQRLFVYGQENKACKRCGHPITKMKVSNRGTHICEVCQPLNS
ncbi:formamidopyrimidine-DNA glycosylase [Paraliobacillus ryukyuensis]|uniref:Formamidopyrimidine-DNA glycosylase n=1 Tax=Paraliobacillus ryukyuensis TaxID=200904 RepID=A0A366EAR9_9BACI|nr:DNA-formamidopyrimidine glycosylase [Paraliobacillus ryukyuensis]RBO99412.1 DNA-(apurinic or apyrimidinic site) lyase [Paraliobacillus ryukyuensis]